MARYDDRRKSKARTLTRKRERQLKMAGITLGSQMRGAR